MRVCLCARPAWCPELLASGAVRGCVLGPGLQPRPATPGWASLRRVCVCLRAPLVPRHSWLGCAVWACLLGSGSSCAPPLLVGVLGCLCVCACAPLAPRHSWRAGVCVCGFGLRPLSGFPGFLAWVLGRVPSCARRVRVPSPPWGAACGVGVCRCCRRWGLASPLPFGFFFQFSFSGGCPGVSRPGLLVSVAGCPGLWSRGLRPPFYSRLGCAFVYFLSFFRVRPSVVSVCVFGMSLLPVGRCSRFGVAGFGWVFLWCLFRGSRLWCRLAEAFGHLLRCGWAVLWSSALFLTPPLFFSAGAVCLFLSRPSLGIRCGQAARCWCLCFARPCPPVGYVHAWLGGPSCRVRFWLCRLRGCARRLREALG